MAQDGEVSVKLKITAENGGVAKAEHGLNRVRHAAKKTAEESKSGFDRMKAGIGKLTGAFSAFNTILSGFGAVSFATTIVSGIKKIRDSFSKAKEDAKKFAEEQEKAANAKEIENLAKAYDTLTKSINNTAAARAHNNEIEDIELKNARDLEDAQIDLAEQQELNGVDPNDKAAEEVRAEIKARYEERRNNVAEKRKEFDGVRERDRLRQSAVVSRKEADDIEKSASEYDELIKKAKARRNAALSESVRENKEDNTSFLDRLGSNAKKIVTLEWGSVGDDRTEEGDALRQKAAEEAKKEQATIDSLEAEKARQLEVAKNKRTAAERAEQKADALGGSVQAQEVRSRVVRMQGAQAVKSAEQATDRKDAQQAAEAKRLKDAEMAQRALVEQKASVQARIDSEQKKKDAANFAVFQAQGQMDAARLGGNRRNQQSALSNLQSAKVAAQNVNFAADQLINKLTETLKNVEAKLNQVDHVLESGKKQQRNFMSEAPAGE